MNARPQPITPGERLYRIVEDGMCTGCGICQSIAGVQSVSVELVESGYERPVVVGPLTHETVDQILDVCPGTRLEGLPEELVDQNTATDKVWGPYHRMTRGYATDPATRFQGSTGGVLTALGQYLLASGEVSFIVHIKASDAHPTFGERHVSVTGADVLAGAGSRYGPSAPLIDIHHILDRDEPFAFIGKPCDVAALRNLAHIDARVNKLVRYWLAPVCGGYMPPTGMNRFLKDSYAVAHEDVETFRYRGYGCPGKTHFTTTDGRTQECRYTDFWGTDETQWQLPFRCKVCPDGIGEAADIAAADDWPGGGPDPATEDEDAGTNSLVVRTARGVALVEAAQAAGFLTLENDVDPRYMDSVQPHQMKKKYVVRARWDGLASRGRTVPRSARLRLDELNDELDAAMYSAQTEGTRNRVDAGKTSETMPARRER
jgi:coenzyme F420 hydrogenase subunit beta